jgi:hypothetical protein
MYKVGQLIRYGYNDRDLGIILKIELYDESNEECEHLAPFTYNKIYYILRVATFGINDYWQRDKIEKLYGN